MRSRPFAALVWSFVLACVSEPNITSFTEADASTDAALPRDSANRDLGPSADRLALQPERADSPGDRSAPDAPADLAADALADLADLAADLADTAAGPDRPAREAREARNTGARFPFPQNRPSRYCTFPSAAHSDDVQAAYDLWKKATVTDKGAGGYMRVNRVRDDEPGQEWTVSEGIAYGMILAVYMDDQELFDNLWNYEQLWLNGNGLMDWKIDQNGTTRLGTGAATDADEDMAWALVMADKQWGGQGKLRDTYLNFAKKMIQAIWDKEIDHNRAEMVLAGDSWGGGDVTNISYYAPAYYRVFGQVSGKVADWNKVIDTLYAIIDKSLNATSGNTTNGLVPAWCTFAGVPTAPFANAPLHHQYDSCRTPFRIGLDYCLFGEPRAKAYLDKLNSFHDKLGAKNIGDGYNLDGTPRPELVDKYGQAAAFIGPAGVGAMSNSAFAKLAEDSYALVASLELIPGERYYNQSWTVLALLAMTGNFLDYTEP